MLKELKEYKTLLKEDEAIKKRIKQFLDRTVSVQKISFRRIPKSHEVISNRIMKTLTLDNDILFKMHKSLEKLLRVKIYFCNPYHSWEKGSIENVNKYIRRYIPKGSDLSRYEEEYIEWLEIKCNERYMKCLKYATPEEKLTKHRKRKTRHKKTA